MRAPKRRGAVEFTNLDLLLAMLEEGTGLTNPNIAASGITLAEYHIRVSEELGVSLEVAADVGRMTGVPYCIGLRDWMSAPDDPIDYRSSAANDAAEPTQRLWPR